MLKFKTLSLLSLYKPSIILRGLDYLNHITFDPDERDWIKKQIKMYFPIDSELGNMVAI